MRCERIIREYLELEDRSRIPFAMRIHILLCRGCRSEIVLMNRVFSSMRRDTPYRAGIDFAPAIMDIIRRESGYAERTISGIKWIAIGTVIFFSILLVNFSESYLWLNDTFGSNYTIPVSIVMGFAFTAYASIVIGCNYEDIKKFIELHSKWRFK